MCVGGGSAAVVVGVVVVVPGGSGVGGGGGGGRGNVVGAVRGVGGGGGGGRGNVVGAVRCVAWRGWPPGCPLQLTWSIALSASSCTSRVGARARKPESVTCELCQTNIRNRVTAWIIVSAGGVNNPELARVELCTWPFQANVCFHSDISVLG